MTSNNESREYLEAARAAHSALADLHKVHDKRPHASLVQAHRDVQHAMKTAEVHALLAIAENIQTVIDLVREP